VIVSFNEIETMGKRAARGAGMTFGLADEAGKAARWLAVHGLPGPEKLADLLDQQDGVEHAQLAPTATDGTWEAPGGRLCPLVAGAALCDRAAELAGGREITLGAVSHPMLLAWDVSTASSLIGQNLELVWDDVVMTFGLSGVRIDGSDETLATSATQAVRCRRISDTGRGVADPAFRSNEGGWKVDEARWVRLGEFAHRTYAPATEESRLTGAGAGLIDD